MGSGTDETVPFTGAGFPSLKSSDAKAIPDLPDSGIVIIYETGEAKKLAGGSGKK